YYHPNSHYMVITGIAKKGKGFDLIVNDPFPPGTSSRNNIIKKPFLYSSDLSLYDSSAFGFWSFVKK
ncbi:MAG TPA: hypothetical protein PK263_04395, partial [bacterium]|nr:hypothetical protein [bacterium]